VTDDRDGSGPGRDRGQRDVDGDRTRDASGTWTDDRGAWATDPCVGVDRAPDGWVAVTVGDGPPRAALHDSVRALWRAVESVDTVLVDLPVGLPSPERPDREPDALARSVLGDRRASVFSPPARAALGAEDHATASARNREAVDKGLSIQAYNILPPVRELDAFLRETPQAVGVLRESHPEVCFRALAGAELAHSKTSAGGFAERLAVLEDRLATLAGGDGRAPRESGGTDATDERPRRAAGLVADLAGDLAGLVVGVDDVVDATVLALTAHPGGGPLRTLPPAPATDEAGLPVEMVYRARESLVE
jgi:predicted RNase H-like nuclease